MNEQKNVFVSRNPMELFATKKIYVFNTYLTEPLHNPIESH